MTQHDQLLLANVREAILRRRGDVVTEGLVKEVLLDIQTRGRVAAPAGFTGPVRGPIVSAGCGPQSVPDGQGATYQQAELRIREAIAWARGQRINVRPGTSGVQYGELSSTWVEDAFEEGVSAIGAFLLLQQTEEDAPMVAASDLLDVSNAFCHGVDDGFADSADDHWIRSPHKATYTAGHKFGLELRKELQ